MASGERELDGQINRLTSSLDELEDWELEEIQRVEDELDELDEDEFTQDDEDLEDDEDDEEDVESDWHARMVEEMEYAFWANYDEIRRGVS